MSEIPFSRRSGCRVTDALHYYGLQLIVLENELLRVAILPEKGGEIYSIQYKPKDIDPLLHYRPLQTPTPFPATIPLADGAFSDIYDGGWQVMFPSGGGANSALGAAFGRHGEAALLSWSWQILQDDAALVTVRLWARMARTPFLYERELSLASGKAVLFFTDRITNQGGESMPYMWGHHPAFGAPFLDGSCVLEVPAKWIESVTTENHAARVPANLRSKWPVIKEKNGHTLDLSLIPAEGGHSSDMFFLTDLSKGWYALTNRNLGLGFALAWDEAIFPVLWVWQEFGGGTGHPWYSNTYALGLEPCTHYATSGTSGLSGVIERGEAKFLAPGEQAQVQLKAILYEVETYKRIRTVTAEGNVLFES